MGKVIRVAIYRTNGTSEDKLVPNELSSLQGIVGGYIETLTLSRSLIVVCDEEGYIKHKRRNPFLDCIYGDFFICGAYGDEFASLTDIDKRTFETLIKERKTVCGR